MYNEKNLVYIFTMLECIEKCWIYTADFDTPDDFIWANEQKELNAVVSLFVAIGEESKKIEQTLKEAVSSKIKWPEVAGIRDKISHDYRGIDEDILWAILKNDLFQLKNALLEMFKFINPDKEIVKEFLQSPYYKHLLYLKKL